jgi:ATP-binding cassette subfamily B protein
LDISFLKRRKILDYKLFEQRSKNQNKTYQLIQSMQETKLQNCDKRKRWEWEDVQADLFDIQKQSMGLFQKQEIGNIVINEIKNITITIAAAIHTYAICEIQAVVCHLHTYI